MEIGTSENFSHGQIGSNSQNYGQMKANGYGSSQISNARPMSMSGKSSQSNMRSMVGTSSPSRLLPPKSAELSSGSMSSLVTASSTEMTQKKTCSFTRQPSSRTIPRRPSDL